MNDQWAPTRHGGFRRLTRAAQTDGKTGLATVDGAEAIARAGAEKPVTPVSTQVAHFRNTEKVVGSNPTPRTKKWIVKFNERLGLPTCPYLIRWRIETPWGSVRLHHWLGPDDDRAKHDHPWGFRTFVLKGGYTDLGVDGDQHLRAPATCYREATHQHTVVPDEGGCWTIIFTGPKVRNWGFWVKGKFVKMNKYFLTYGHHPCD